MKLEYRDIDYSSIQDCQLLVSWGNDPEIRHLVNQFDDEESFLRYATVESVMGRKEKDPNNGISRRLMILADGRPIGFASFIMDPPYAFTKMPGTAWLSIVIGEKCARGGGLGREVMEYLERLAMETGAKQFEIGVFEFNGPARRLYERCGYREVTRIPEFTYWNGRKWTDIRMAKAVG